MQNPLSHRTALATVLPAVMWLALSAHTARAIAISGYTADLNNRFISGFGASLDATPIANPGGSFVGAGLDFSGAGWVPGSGFAGGSRVHNVTLLTPLHIIEATHLGSSNNTSFRFQAQDGAVRSATLLKGTTFSTGTYSNDIRVDTLADVFETAQLVTPYRVLDLRGGNLTGVPLLICGSNADGIGPRLGLAVGGTAGLQVQNWSSAGVNGSAVYWESGDSGSPSFVRYTPPGGAATLTFSGAAWFSSGFSTLLENSTGTYNPAPGVNAITKLDGYAIKWTIYDNVADSTRTAPQWTGATDANLATSANWTQSLAPANNPVLFDAGAAGGVTTLSLGGDLALRGALFKSSASSAGFTINGTGILTLGRTGLRNESTATQTLNTPIALSDSQNWEAANGDLVVNAGIDTTAGAHLLSIGGDHDTALNGIVSGSGALAKDGDGVLTLNTTGTYTGKTWIHQGTLRLGPAGNLPAGTEVIFDTNNTALLDLNGRDQSLAGLRSAYDGTVNVDLGGGTLSLSPASTSTAIGSITGSGGLTKNGTGLLTLEGGNTYTGATTINGGTLRVDTADALPSGSNIVLNNGAVLELGVGAPDFTASLGTGPGQLRFAGSGGFSASGTNHRVNLGGLATPATFTWGETNFVPSGGFLIFSSSVASATIDFQNSIILGTSGGTGRSLLASDGTAAVDARISGNLTQTGGSFGINKYNTGTLELTGVNTYTGATGIYGGTLRIGSAAALPAASNIILGGGVLELAAGDFTGSLGTGAGQIRFTNSGGFSAAGADRAVNIGGAATPQTLYWGQTDFIPDASTLLLSTTGADATVDLRNSIVLGTSGAATRTIQVNNGAAAVDARISGDLIQNGGAFALTKNGSGTLELTGTSNYSGPTIINSGAIRISSAGALSPATNLVLNGGVLELAAGDYTASLGTGAGELRFTGNAGFSAAGADRTVNIGGAATPRTLSWGATNFIASGQVMYLSSAGADATVILRNSIDLGSSGSGLRGFTVNNGSASVDARITGDITQSGGTFGITKYGYGTLELTGANTYAGTTRIVTGALRISSAGALPATSNVVLEGGVLELAQGNYAANIGTAAGQVLFNSHGGFSAVGGDRTVTLNGGATIIWGDNTGIDRAFNLMLSSAGADSTIELTNPLQLSSSGASARTVQVDDGSAAIDGRLSGIISQDSATYGLTKTGPGTLEITAANTYLGPTLVNQGALLVNGNQSVASGGCTVAAGATLGGVGRISGNLSLATGARLALITKSGSTRGPDITGSISFAGSVTVTADQIGATLAPGTYTLLTYGGVLTGSPDLSWSPPAGSELTATFDLTQAGSIRITLAAPTLLAQWRTTHFGTDPYPEIAGDTADPDEDGLPNLVEYALGGDPWLADSQRLPGASVTGDRLHLTFNRIADPALTYQVEATDDLAGAAWQTIWNSTGAQNTAGPVTVNDTVLLSAHPARFLRLKVLAP